MIKEETKDMQRGAHNGIKYFSSYLEYSLGSSDFLTLMLLYNNFLLGINV